MKTLLIGLGTGRCGTQSLAHMLDSHPQIHMGHERGIKLPWIPNQAMFDTQMATMLATSSEQELVRGDVASYWLPYVPMLSQFAKHNERRYRLRFIALERPVEEVVASFDRKVKGNHWTVGEDNPKHPFSQCFPKYEVPKKEAIAKYCEEYRLGIARIQQANQSIIARITTEQLNHPNTMHEIFAWLDLKFEHVAPLHLNKGGPKPKQKRITVAGSHLPPRGRRLRRELPRKHKR